jgi:subtilisin family serine protease
LVPVATPLASTTSAAAVAGEYVVTFDPDVDAVAKARKERALGNEVSDVFSEAVEGFVATLDANDVRRLRSDGDVLAVEPNSTIRVAATPGRYIVQLRSGASAFGTASAVGATNVRAYTNAITGFAADLTAEAYDALSADPNVISIEPDVMVQTSDTQLSPVSWGLDRIDQRALPLDSSYTYPNRAQGVRAYVIDTGVRASHVQFGGRVAAGYDGVLDGNGTNDCNGHGTHVAGTIAGVTAGVAKAATVVPVRVLGCNGSGWMSVVIAGIDWVIADHEVGQPAVANLSLGGDYSPAMNAAVERGVDDGIVFVVAAGNSNENACNASPASEATALTVGASGSSDLRASFSNWGSCLDVFAPGVGIASASHTGDTIMGTLSGTSMAAPHVAGAAALILGGEPSLSPAQVAARVLTGATTNALGSVGIGSPNRLLFTGSTDVPVAPTTTVVSPTTTTVAPTTTTTVAPTTTTTVPRPANDHFENAETISGSNGVVLGSNVNATREANEPDHHSPTGSASVWYRWTASADGQFVLSTEVSSALPGEAGVPARQLDTLLGVYTGSGLGALALRAANDDYSTVNGQLWSRVAIEVSAGTTYNIAVDGWGGAKGQIKLSWSFISVVEPPDSIVVRELNEAAHVSWQPSTSMRTLTLTYVATASPGGRSCSTTKNACVIGGLTNGLSYTVSVIARSPQGESVASDPSHSFSPNFQLVGRVPTPSWGLDRIDQEVLPLDGFIERTTSGRGTLAYVIDTGVYAAHDEFRGRVAAGYSSVGDERGTDDCNGHGTHVAGTIAGTNFGVAPGATIVPVRVLDCWGEGSTAAVLAGINWMIARHVPGTPAVANLSLGGDYSPALNAAVERAVSAGISVVVAAGNSAVDARSTSPASAVNAVTVGATDVFDKKAHFSNFGSCVDIFAPGVQILSATLGGASSFTSKSGTSMAAPHVAGAVALLASQFPLESPSELTQRLLKASAAARIQGLGSDTANRLLRLGEGASGVLGPQNRCVPGRIEDSLQPPITTVPESSVPPTTSTPEVTAPPANTAPTTAAPTPAPTTTTAPSTAVPTTAIATEQVQFRASDIGALETLQPRATVVRTSSDRVLLRISNARGTVDVLVNGKILLKTKKRVLLLKSKGIGAKRVTVRASATK